MVCMSGSANKQNSLGWISSVWALDGGDPDAGSDTTPQTESMVSKAMGARIIFHTNEQVPGHVMLFCAADDMYTQRYVS